MILSIRKANFLMYISLLIFISGCASKSASVSQQHKSTPAEEQSLLNAFYDGKASLITPGWISGAGKGLTYGRTTRERREYYDQRAWEALVLSTLKVNLGDNLAWFYLGRAAEELGYICSALKYYEKSIQLSESVLTRCLGRVCSGFTFPDDPQLRIEKIKEHINKERKCNTQNK